MERGRLVEFAVCPQVKSRYFLLSCAVVRCLFPTALQLVVVEDAHNEREPEATVSCELLPH